MIDSSVGLAFVGTLVPDTEAFHTPAFSRAGHLKQKGLLMGLKNAGLPPSIVISARPIQSFPGSNQLWVGGKKTSALEGFDINLLAFFNISPIKQIMIGLGTIFQLLSWFWRTDYKKRIVYTYNLSVPPGFFTWVGARLIGAEVMVSIDDINVPGQTVPNTFFFRLDYFLQRWLIPKFDGHIVVTDQIMEDFAPGKSYLRVDGGIFPVVLEETKQPTDNYQNPNGLFKIVFIGSLDEADGIRVVLEAFKLLRGDHFRLFIAGKGPLLDIVNHAVQEDSRIVYLGFIPFSEVLQLYKETDVLINMRITQSLNTEYFFPSKVIEFLASGTPVISTCSGHMEEEYGEICYLLRSETPHMLAKSIERVASLDINERLKTGTDARAYMIKNKTWNAQGIRLRDYIINSMLEMK